MITNAICDGRWDASRKLGNRNQYNPFSASWKSYEKAFGIQEKVCDALVDKSTSISLEDLYQMLVSLDTFKYFDYQTLYPYISDWKSGKTYLDTKE